MKIYSIIRMCEMNPDYECLPEAYSTLELVESRINELRSQLEHKPEYDSYGLVYGCDYSYIEMELHFSVIKIEPSALTEEDKKLLEELDND